MAPVLACYFFVDYRRTLLVGFTAAIMTICLFVTYDVASGGWLSFYTITLPAGHSMKSGLPIGFWTVDLIPLATLLIIGPPALADIYYHDLKTGVRTTGIVLGGLIAAYVGRLHSWGWINVLIPAHVVLALLGGLTICHFERTKNTTVGTIISLMIVWQMAILTYDIFAFIPTASAAKINNAFLEEISKVDGEVLTPDIQFVQSRVGKKSYDLGMAAVDLLRSDLGDRNYIKWQFASGLDGAIAQKKFSLIIPGHIVFRHLAGLPEHYTHKSQTKYSYGYTTDSGRSRLLGMYFPREEGENNGDLDND